jgi:hypothetical protein
MKNIYQTLLLVLAFSGAAVAQVPSTTDTTDTTYTAADAADAEAQAHEAWSETIVRTDVPEEGCFHASYPSTQWTKVACTTAPNIAYPPRKGAIGLTVGDGVDYSAEVPGLISRSMGYFPSVSGVTSETGLLGANDYSLQLNSNFMTTAACHHHSSCLSWEQFVYASDYETAFMQYWLIDYGDTCPNGWTSNSGSCYKNSAAVSAPSEPISELAHLKISGNAVLNKRDTLTFTTATEAYSTTGNDTVVDLATAWQASEFNIFGDGDGSSAVFNKGSVVRVRISLTDGSTTAPTCAVNSGTTAETNNLKLRTCATGSATMPWISFTESN